MDDETDCSKWVCAIQEAIGGLSCVEGEGKGAEEGGESGIEAVNTYKLY
jgi:hypothetical protein